MRRRARPAGARQVDLVIERVGAMGDGEATLNGQPVFVPLSLPGERLRARIVSGSGGRWRGEILELLEPSAERCEAPCPHFGPCGGCALQHWDAQAYQAWKADLLVTAFRRRGLDCSVVEPMHRIPIESRRRATLAAQRRGRNVVLGYHERRSHKVVPIEVCPILRPALVALFVPLKVLLRELLADEGDRLDVVLLETKSGIDLLLRGETDPTLEQREDLVRFADDQDLARLSWATGREECLPVVERRRPVVSFGGYEVVPRPGAFLQPSLAGEDFLTSQVRDALAGKAENMLDLYAGSGTFALSLSGLGSVHAVEGDPTALTALREAVNREGLAGRVTMEERDLARRPLLSDELEPYDAVVFDPPRAGAKEQSAILADAGPAKVVAVSCNPTTLARDAALLCKGGYRLDRAVSVDQFPWSGHLEAVALFSR